MPVSAALFEVLAIPKLDRSLCRARVDEADRNAVSMVKAALVERLGSYSDEPLDLQVTDPWVWLAAYFDLTPALMHWYTDLGVPKSVVNATMADVGRQLQIYRLLHGEFGLETSEWLIPHYTGMMFALGRLNYTLRQTKLDVPGVLTSGDWVAGIHIPQTGSLTPELVDASLDQASDFFATVFTKRGVRFGVCETWLLDPYLQQHLPADSNIVSFARRYTLAGPLHTDATAALYFIFRSRDISQIPELPRDSTLQRLVLDRARAEDEWQIGTGYLPLDRVIKTTVGELSLAVT